MASAASECAYDHYEWHTNGNGKLFASVLRSIDDRARITYTHTHTRVEIGPNKRSAVAADDDDAAATIVASVVSSATPAAAAPLSDFLPLRVEFVYTRT